MTCRTLNAYGTDYNNPVQHYEIACCVCNSKHCWGTSKQCHSAADRCRSLSGTSKHCHTVGEPPSTAQQSYKWCQSLPKSFQALSVRCPAFPECYLEQITAGEVISTARAWPSTACVFPGSAGVQPSNTSVFPSSKGVLPSTLEYFQSLLENSQSPQSHGIHCRCASKHCLSIA